MEKHSVVKFYSECTYMKIEVMMVGSANNPSGFFTMLVSLA